MTTSATTRLELDVKITAISSCILSRLQAMVLGISAVGIVLVKDSRNHHVHHYSTRTVDPRMCEHTEKRRPMERKLFAVQYSPTARTMALMTSTDTTKLLNWSAMTSR